MGIATFSTTQCQHARFYEYKLKDFYIRQPDVLIYGNLVSENELRAKHMSGLHPDDIMMTSSGVISSLDKAPAVHWTLYRCFHRMSRINKLTFTCEISGVPLK